MNNLNDYYNYLNNYNDMNFMTNPNTMITDMNYQNMFPNNYTIPNTNTNSSITDSQIGFKRGNLFNNLYDEYKNYKSQELKASNEREDLILQIDENRFATIELGLYLDLYPNDINALNTYNSYLKKEKELITQYENKYGPLTLSSPIQTNTWLWDNSPWPWEVQK